MTAQDAFALERFVEAQDRGGAYDHALAEIRAGRKQSHWIWFVFPQLMGLGQSHTARFFGVSSLDEARAYLDHPQLGPRLAVITEAVQLEPGSTLTDLFGRPDDLKFISSMTLFDVADGRPFNLYGRALGRLGERPDRRTLDLLRS